MRISAAAAINNSVVGTLFSAILLIVTPAEAQLRIVDYNTTGGPRAGLETVLEAIGQEVINGFAKPIDVLILQEQTSSATTTEAIVDVLNGLDGAGTYARATLDGATSGAGRPGLIYNTATIELIDQVAFGTVNTSAQAVDPTIPMTSADCSSSGDSPSTPTPEQFECFLGSSGNTNSSAGSLSTVSSGRDRHHVRKDPSGRVRRNTNAPCSQPIVVDEDGVIVVGHTRWKSGEEASAPDSAPPSSVDADFPDVLTGC